MAQQYKCSQCGATFNSESELRAHAQSHHAGPGSSSQGGGAGKYRCDACGATFNTEQELQQHARTMHQKT